MAQHEFAIRTVLLAKTISMTKMIAVYKTPKDKPAFDDHYFNVHVPLAHRLPGLLRYEVNDGTIFSTTGHDDVYRVAILHFESIEAMIAAFASDIETVRRRQALTGR
jgi:uncharacterized protein (TIGR02118 family)